MATVFAWISAVAGFTGLVVRWHESYLLRPDAGHIPVANLYEVFILFLVITALMYLYYEKRFGIRKLGGFVFAFMAVVVGFVLWYSVSREAHAIQPLIPALQSWWMKIHVPANFIGYGAFCIAAMLGCAALLALGCEDKGRKSWLPHSQVIEEVMYKAIAVGPVKYPATFSIFISSNTTRAYVFFTTLSFAFFSFSLRRKSVIFSTVKPR